MYTVIYCLNVLPCTELRRGSFNRARFARDGSLGLYTVVNVRGDGYLLHWEQVRNDFGQWCGLAFDSS